MSGINQLSVEEVRPVGKVDTCQTLHDAIHFSVASHYYSDSYCST